MVGQRPVVMLVTHDSDVHVGKVFAVYKKGPLYRKQLVNKMLGAGLQWLLVIARISILGSIPNNGFQSWGSFPSRSPWDAECHVTSSSSKLSCNCGTGRRTDACGMRDGMQV